MVWVLVAVVIGLMACGPSSAQIKTAREARYRASAAEIFQAGVTALDGNGYKIARIDPVASRAMTVERWYEADGTYMASDATGRPMFLEGMIVLRIELGVMPEGETFKVEVIPHVIQFRESTPKGYELRADDPQLPGFVIDKVNNIYLSVYEKLKPNVVARGT
jgi:hypothetical protein